MMEDWELDPRLCVGRNGRKHPNICVAEGCFDEACVTLGWSPPEKVEPSATNDRGFMGFPPLTCRDGDVLDVRESSLATEACLWLTVTENDGTSATAHMTLSQAYEFAQRIQRLADNHYHFRTSDE